MPECDFCSRKPVVRRYPCRDFDSESQDVGVTFESKVGEATNLVLASKNYWASCEECSKLVDAHDIDGLVDRAITLLRPSSPIEAKLRAHLQWTYWLFFQNRLPEVRVS